MVTRSHFITPTARATLATTTADLGWDVDATLKQTDPSGLMEGLYVKVEQDGVVKERYKFVRREDEETDCGGRRDSADTTDTPAPGGSA